MSDSRFIFLTAETTAQSGSGNGLKLGLLVLECVLSMIKNRVWLIAMDTFLDDKDFFFLNGSVAIE